MRTYLQAFHSVLLRTHRLAFRYPRWVLAGTVLLMLLAASQLPQLKIIYNIDHLITSDFASYQGLRQLETEFQQQNALFVTLLPERKQWTQAQLCQVQAAFQDVDYKQRPFLRIDSPLELRFAQSKPDSLSYPRLLNLNCISPDLAESIVSLDVFRQSPWENTLVYLKDGALSFEMSLIDASSERTAQVMKSLEQAFPTGVKILWTGSAAFQKEMKAGYDRTDAINLVLIVLMFILFRVFYGTWSSTLFFLSTLVVTALILYGVMGYMGWPIDLLTNVLFIIILIATLEDFVLLSSVQTNALHKSWRSHYRVILIPSFYTSLTTLFGFTGLLTSETEMIRRFGVLTALGAGVEWFVLFLSFPALAQIWPRARTWTRPQQAFELRFLKKIAAWTPSRPVGQGILLLGALGLLLSSQLRFKDSPFQIFSLSHPLRVTESYFKERGWFVDAHLLFSDGADRAFQREVIEKLRQDPAVGAVDSPEDALAFYEKGLDAQRRNLVESEVRQAPALNRYFGPKSAHSSSARAVLYLRDDEIQSVNDLRQRVQDICQNRCQLAGSLVSYAEFGASIPRFLVESLLVSLGLVSIVLIILARDRGAPLLPILISSFLGPALLLFLLWASQAQIYFVTTIFASILVGLTGDNAIHFLYASEHSLSEGIDNRAAASIQISVALLIIPLLLLLSPFVPLQKLGLLFAAGTAVSFLADVSFLKSILTWSKPK